MVALGLGFAFAGALVGDLEAEPALSPLLVWSTVWVWLGVAVALALIVTVVGHRPGYAGGSLRGLRGSGPAGFCLKLAPRCVAGNGGGQTAP
ncbi:MAG: hypothetical protein U0587_09420 [Candidatus Binatia bacterium]